MALQTITPKFLVDDILLREGLTAVQRWSWVGFLVVAFLFTTIVLRMVFWHLSYRMFLRVREDVVTDLRASFFRHINSLCLRFHGGTNSGELFSYIFGSPLSNIQQYGQQLALFGPSALFTLLASLAVVATWDGWMATTLTLSVLSSVLVLNYSKNRISALHQEFQSAEREITGRVADLIRGSREIKLYAVESHIISEFEGQAQSIAGKVIQRDVRTHMEWMKQEGVGYVFFGVLCVVGAWRFLEHGLKPGELLTYLTAFIALQGPLQQLLQTANLGAAAEASFGRIQAVLSTVSTTPDPAEPKPVPMRGEICFHDVHFTYASKAVLNGLSFTVPYGQRVAIVGPSGAGKTTVSQLILRLYDPNAGAITLGGVSLKYCIGAELRRCFGVVPQAPYFFQTTIRNNLLLVAPEASAEAVQRACELANAWEFIAQLPEGLDTRLGEGGSTLSGGQRQRLAIARALLLNPPYFIFDEATSALDTVSEKLIQDSIERNIRGKTALFIAHRLATIQSCDRVLVLQEGRLVQDGTFAELSEVEGLFRHMVHADVFANRG